MVRILLYAVSVALSRTPRVVHPFNLVFATWAVEFIVMCYDMCHHLMLSLERGVLSVSACCASNVGGVSTPCLHVEFIHCI